MKRAAAFLISCACASSPPARTTEGKLFVDGGGGRLRVSDGGSGGVAVVFHHGLGSDWTCWQAQLEHVRATRRAVAFDARGHGESDRAPVYSIEALADDLDRVVAQLGITRFILVGHSFAGNVISAYAGRHPEKLAALVYADAVGDASGAPAEVKEYFRKQDAAVTPERLQEMYAKMLGPKAKPETRRRILASVARLDVPAFAALRGQMGDFHAREALAPFTGPKFVIDGEGDDSPAAAAHLPGVQRRTIPGVSHWLMLDDPQAFNGALDEVLAEVSASSGRARRGRAEALRPALSR
jgi:pimeloyl-ACP methyl ester carboxylesterase